MYRCTDTRRSRAWLATTALALMLALQACAPGPARRAPSVASTAPSAPINDDARAQYAAALSLIDNGQAEDAKAALHALVAQHPRLSGAWTNLGILQARADDTAAALISFTQACQSNPENLIAWNWRASLLRQQRRYLEAEQAYLAALRIDEADAYSHRNLALLYDLNLGRTQDALDHYRRYQQLSDNPLIVQAWIHRLEDQLQSSQTRLAEQSTP